MEKYRVVRVVGEGSFGKALLCARKSDEKKCIIKEISLAKMGPKEAKMTEQESALLARLQHPNIVTFWESFMATKNRFKNLYIVMDFADGGDLANLIKGRNGRYMPESQVIALSVQISLAIKHIHDRKILHRDLKCANVFLTKKGIVKLGDFGIAKVLRSTGDLAVTQIGTPYFMSPEILDNKKYNSKTDIWSLGCVIYELMRLKVPFDGASMKQLVHNIIQSPMPPLPQQFSKELRQLVQAMLSKKHKDRPSINTVLTLPVFRDRIAEILDDSLRQQEFCHTVLHGGNILSRAPLVPASAGPVPSVHAQPEANLQAANPRSREKARAPVAPSNEALAAQARAEAEVIAARRAQREAREQERLAKEKERAVLVKEREKAARVKLRHLKAQQREKAQADEALRIEACKVHEQEERIRREERQMEIERAREKRRSELLKLRAAAAEREQVRAEEERKKAQEDRDRRMVEKEKKRDRPWRVDNSQSAASAIAAKPTNTADLAPNVVAVDGLAADLPREEHIRNPKAGLNPRYIVETGPENCVSRESDVSAHDLIVEEALARRSKQTVDKEAARERREKFEQLRAGRRHHDDAVKDGQERIEGVAGGSYAADDTERPPCNEDVVITEEVQAAGAGAGGPPPKRNRIHKKRAGDLEWLNILQDDMGDLKHQMDDLKSDQSSRRRSQSAASCENNPQQGFSVGNAAKKVPTAATRRRKSAGRADKGQQGSQLGKIVEEAPPLCEDVRKNRRDRGHMDLKRFLKSQRKKNRKKKPMESLPAIASPNPPLDKNHGDPSKPDTHRVHNVSCNASSSLPPVPAAALRSAEESSMFRSGILPKLTVDILESRVGNTGDTRSPMRFSLDDINLERKRNTPVGAVTGTQDDINSPRFHSGPRQWDSPSNMDMAEGNVRFDDCVNDLDNARTIDMRKHASRKKKTKKEKDDDNGNIYDVDIEIDDDVGAVQNMAIDDYEYGSVLAAMEEVLKLPQKYSGDIICSDIDDWSGEGTCGPVFEDGDEFEETAQDRMFVDCVIDGEDGHESDASSGESSSDSVSGCSHPSDYRDGSGSKDNEDDELLNNDGDGPLQEDKDAVTARVDNLRQYLESCVGPVNFVKAYSLLRVVESSDDDDALLHEMESIVGVEGLFLMDSFIKLISLEDEIIDQYGD